MRKREKAKRIHVILDEIYPDPPIPLDHKDAYTLLVAVLLSAQCTDERVNMVTPALFAMADNPGDMAAQDVADILDKVKSCGLAPTKSKNIKALSEMLVQRHEGQVPDDLGALEALPGVGHKTASVVMCQAFGVPAFPVDTHIHRLAKRWGLSEGRNVVQVERDLKKLFPKRSWIKLHLQIIMFGREYCPARRHDPKECRICSWAGTTLS